MSLINTLKYNYVLHLPTVSDPCKSGNRGRDGCKILQLGAKVGGTTAMSGYDPSNFRPGHPGWTGQVGKIAVVNTTDAPVEINLYHPDAPASIFGTYQIEPGANNFLVGDGNIGMDWGIQVGNSEIKIVGLVSDWNEFNGEFIFQTWPARILANLPIYNPASFRPGTRGWTGQIGRIAFINLSDKTLWVKLYHPDAPASIFGTYQIEPGANNFLVGDGNIGMDWGIQVGNSEIKIVGLVSDWGKFQGTYNFQTWAERVIQPSSKSVEDQILHALRKFAWTWTLRCGGITPSKFSGNECDIEKGGGDGVGDSVIFSSILCYSGERWACESIRQSQGPDGRMWRSPQRIGVGDRPEIRGKNGEFSRDQLLGAMLYMVVSANAGRRDEAQSFGNQLWEWVVTKRRNEIQKALDAITDLNTLRRLLADPRGVLDTVIGGAVPSRYRICDFKDDYCSISLIPYGHWGRLMLEVWQYVGADTSITKSVSKKISLPSIPTRSLPISNTAARSAISIPGIHIPIPTPPIPSIPGIPIPSIPGIPIPSIPGIPIPSIPGIPTPPIPGLSQDLSIPIDFSLLEYAGLDYNLIFLQNDFGSLDLGPLKDPSEFHDHLSVVTALILREMGKANVDSEARIQLLASKNPNPFFLWAAGKSDEAKEKVLEICPRTRPDKREQWAWERAYSKESWRESYGFDFIAAINLILGDTDPVAAQQGDVK